jgi:hypothetical protein
LHYDFPDRDVDQALLATMKRIVTGERATALGV